MLAGKCAKYVADQHFMSGGGSQAFRAAAYKA